MRSSRQEDFLYGNVDYLQQAAFFSQHAAPVLQQSAPGLQQSAFFSQHFASALQQAVDSGKARAAPEHLPDQGNPGHGAGDFVSTCYI